MPGARETSSKPYVRGSESCLDGRRSVPSGIPPSARASTPTGADPTVAPPPPTAGELSYPERLEKGAAAEELKAICSRVSDEFRSKRRVLSFAEYLELFVTDPARHSRDAAQEKCTHENLPVTVGLTILRRSQSIHYRSAPERPLRDEFSTMWLFGHSGA